MKVVHITCKIANKCLNFCERVEVIEWKWNPLLSCESSVSAKENPDRKKKSIYIQLFQIRYFVEGLYHHMTSRSSHRRYSVKKMFLEISQNSHENTCARVSFFTFFTEHLRATASGHHRGMRFGVTRIILI